MIIDQEYSGFLSDLAFPKRGITSMGKYSELDRHAITVFTVGIRKRSSLPRPTQDNVGSRRDQVLLEQAGGLT